MGSSLYIYGQLLSRVIGYSCVWSDKFIFNMEQIYKTFEDMYTGAFMNKIITIIEKLVLLFWAIFIFIVVVANMKSSYSWLGYDIGKQNKYICIILPLLCVCIYLLHQIPQRKWLNILSGLLILLCQIIIVNSLYTQVGWDSGAIINAALKINLENSNAYLSVYPNNLFLVEIYQFIFFVTSADIESAYLIASFINIILVDIAGLMMVEICKMILDRKRAILSLFFYFLLIAASPWLIIPYSDIFILPFTVGTIYLFLFLENNIEKGKKKINWIILGGLAGVSYSIKPTSIVIFISVVIMILITMVREKKSIYLKKIGFMILGMITILFVIRMGSRLNHTYTLDSNKQMTLTHYAMLALNDNMGVYTEEDYAISQSASSVEEREQVNIAEIQKRIKEKGVKGYFANLWKRCRQILGEGNFNWGGEAGMNFINHDLSKHVYLRNIYYKNGCNYGFYFYGSQAIWFVVLLFNVINVLRIVRGNFNEKEALLYLPVIGVILFNMLFESRSRYLIAFVPFMIIGATGILDFKIIRKLLKSR